MVDNSTNFTRLHSTNSTHNAICPLYEEEAKDWMSAVLITMAILSFCSNLLVIIVICLYRILRTPINILLGELSILGLLNGAILLPVNITMVIRKHNGGTLREVDSLVEKLLLVLSACTIMMMSLERLRYYLAPRKYKLRNHCGVPLGSFLVLIPAVVIIYVWVDERVVGKTVSIFIQYLDCARKFRRRRLKRASTLLQLWVSSSSAFNSKLEH